MAFDIAIESLAYPGMVSLLTMIFAKEGRGAMARGATSGGSWSAS